MEPNSPIPTLRSIISPEALVALVEAAYGLKITRIQLIKAILLDTYRIDLTLRLNWSFWPIFRPKVSPFPLR
jgi:hypothetical protein